MGCDMLVIFGYNVVEIAHVEANCKKSCNKCPNNDDLPIVKTTNVRTKIPTDSPTGSPTDSPTGAPVKKQGPALYSVPLGAGCTINNVCASRSCFRGSCQCNLCDTPGCDDGCSLNETPRYCKLEAYGHTKCRVLDLPTVSPTVPEKSVDLGSPCNEDRVCISNSCHINPNSGVGRCQCSPCAKTDCRGGCPLRTQFCKFMQPLRSPNACVLRTEEPTPTPTAKPSVAKIIIANRSVLVGGICEKDISCKSTLCFIKDNEVFGICQCKHCPFGCRGGCPRADQICRYRSNVAVKNVCVTATSKPTISPTETVTNARTVPLGGKCRKDSWCRSNSCHISSNKAIGTCQCSPCGSQCRGGCPNKLVCRYIQFKSISNRCVAETKRPTRSPRKSPTAMPIGTPTAKPKNDDKNKNNKDDKNKNNSKDDKNNKDDKNKNDDKNDKNKDKN